MARRKIFKNAYFDAIRQINIVLLPHEKRKAFVMVVLTWINALLEVVGLAAILPVVAVITRPEMIGTNEYLKFIYDYFNFSSYDQFTLGLTIAVFSIFLIKFVATTFINYVQAKFSFDISLRLCERQMALLFSSDLEEVKAENSAVYMRDINGVPDVFTKNIILSTLQITTELAVGIFMVAGIVLLDPWIALLVALIMGPSAALIFRSLKSIVKRTGEELNTLTPLIQDAVLRSVHGYSDIKLLNRESYFTQRFLGYKKRVYDKSIWLYIFNQLTPKMIELMGVLGIVAIVFVSFAMSNGDQLLALLNVFAVSAYRMMPSINRILQGFMWIKNYQYTYDIINSTAHKRADMDFGGSEPLEFSNELVLKDLSFYYSGSKDPALDHVNLSIKKGEKVGVIGASGSGKTTLMNVLLRFLIESEGQVLVDNKQLTKANLVTWRSLIGYVQQNIFIADDNLRRNVAFGVRDEEVKDEDVMQALNLASLMDLVSQKQHGLDEELGENGSKVSGGQKQRIGIARALYNNAQILVFDEATSALDPETEKQVTDAIGKLSNSDSLTMLVVAHRFNTLKYCDRIIEMAEGKVVREWTYHELIKKEYGKELFDEQ